MNTKWFSSKLEVSIYVANLLVDAIKNKPNLVLGLATGSTFEEVYHQMITQIKNQNLDLSKITTFNLDEYVGLDEKYHSQSYVHYMNHHFFKGTNINKNNTNFPADYVKDIPSGTKFPEYDKKILNLGKIDIQILGLGENGHIGFNEPGSSLDSITRCVELTPSTITANGRMFELENEVPKRSVTMGIHTITKLSKKIILVALGEKKRVALIKLINATTYDYNWPCTALYDYQDLIIITDLKI